MSISILTTKATNKLGITMAHSSHKDNLGISTTKNAPTTVHTCVIKNVCATKTMCATKAKKLIKLLMVK